MGLRQVGDVDSTLRDQNKRCKNGFARGTKKLTCNCYKFYSCLRTPHKGCKPFFIF